MHKIPPEATGDVFAFENFILEIHDALIEDQGSPKGLWQYWTQLPNSIRSFLLVNRFIGDMVNGGATQVMWHNIHELESFLKATKAAFAFFDIPVYMEETQRFLDLALPLETKCLDYFKRDDFAGWVEDLDAEELDDAFCNDLFDEHEITDITLYPQIDWWLKDHRADVLADLSTLSQIG